MKIINYVPKKETDSVDEKLYRFCELKNEEGVYKLESDNSLLRFIVIKNRYGIDSSVLVFYGFDLLEVACGDEWNSRTFILTNESVIFQIMSNN